MAAISTSRRDPCDLRFSRPSTFGSPNSDESGHNEVSVRAFLEGGTGVAPGKWTVSTAGGEKPCCRRDGKELFYLAPDGKLMAVPVQSGSTFQAGIPVLLFDTHDQNLFNLHYDIQPDGQRFLINRYLEGPAPPVNICLNWLASIKR